MLSGKSSVIPLLVFIILSISLVATTRDPPQRNEIRTKDREQIKYGKQNPVDGRHGHQEKQGRVTETNDRRGQGPNPAPDIDPKVQRKLEKHAKKRQSKVAKFKTQRNKAKTAKDWLKTIQKEAKYLVKWEIKKNELENPSHKENKGANDTSLETILVRREQQRIEKEKAFNAVLIYTAQDQELHDATRYEKEIYFAVWDTRTKQIKDNYHKGLKWKPTYSSMQSYSISSSSSSESSSAETKKKRKRREL